MNYLSPPTVF